jgi:multiple sugar transport system substrate-binding protein
MHRLTRNIIRQTKTKLSAPIQIRSNLRIGYLNRIGKILCCGTIALFVSLWIVACNQESQPPKIAQGEFPPAESALTIWWEKGFALEEDEALQQLVNTWQDETGHAVKLSLYTTDDLAQRTLRALQSGHPPDLVMSHSAELLFNPQLAWQGKLLDVSSVIEPIKETYPPTVLKTVYLYNNTKKQRSYYAVPISQTAGACIFYWRDLVKQAGFDDRQFPQDWQSYWSTWQQIQDKLRQQGQQIYGLGFPLSIGSMDSIDLSEQVLEAFDANIVDSEGNLLINAPNVRQHIQEALQWLTQFYLKDYVPQDAIHWLSPDNNNSLLNRAVVMTTNATLSIPAAIQQDKDKYFNQLGTMGFPDKPNGQPMRYVVLYRQAVVFAEANHHEMAKQFLTYFVNPDILNPYLKTSKRNLPVTKTVLNDPFWGRSKDPHIATMIHVLTQELTRPTATAYHPAYSAVVSERVWTKAIHRILVDRISVEQASDEAIARVKQIFRQWQ